MRMIDFLDKLASREALCRAEQREQTASANLDEGIVCMQCLLVWCDHWLPDEAKEQGARDAMKRAHDWLVAVTVAKRRNATIE